MLQCSTKLWQSSLNFKQNHLSELKACFPYSRKWSLLRQVYAQLYTVHYLSFLFGYQSPPVITLHHFDMKYLRQKLQTLPQRNLYLPVVN